MGTSVFIHLMNFDCGSLSLLHHCAQLFIPSWKRSLRLYHRPEAVHHVFIVPIQMHTKEVFLTFSDLRKSCYVTFSVCFEAEGNSSSLFLKRERQNHLTQLWRNARNVADIVSAPNVPLDKHQESFFPLLTVGPYQLFVREQFPTMYINIACERSIFWISVSNLLSDLKFFREISVAAIMWYFYIRSGQTILGVDKELTVRSFRRRQTWSLRDSLFCSWNLYIFVCTHLTI